MNKIIHFVKYNNFTLILLVLVLLVGSSVLASPVSKTTRIVGVDNTLLLSRNFDLFDMEYKIERIEMDDRYYYVTYTYNDLVSKDNSWQDEAREGTLKITKLGITDDLGSYLARQLSEERTQRVSELKLLQQKEVVAGESKRYLVSEYQGLVGKALNTAGTMFSGYQAVRKVELPSPMPSKSAARAGNTDDDVSNAYNSYIEEHPDLFPVSTTSSTTIYTEILVATTTATTTKIN